jgi:ElaB/YqjD/DUF883 family membrane-anchored ribosome-binding protein
MTAAPPGSTKQQLLDEFNSIVAETEHLLKAVAHTGAEAGSDAAHGLDAKLDENLKAAKERLALLEDAALQRTKAAVQATDTYVRAHPWQAVGLAAALGVIIGLLLRRK